MVNQQDRVDVSDWLFVRDETIGQSPTAWLADPDNHQKGEDLWLFKPVAMHSNGTRQGGDYAEVMSAALAQLLEVPCANGRLASRHGVEGSISQNVTPLGFDLYSGGLWMDSLPDLSYSSAAAAAAPRARGASQGYLFEDVLSAVRRLDVPPGIETAALQNGLDVFYGYLLLDALIANRDRHEKNWAILRATVGETTPLLSPSFDHAGALGYRLPEDRKLALATQGVGLSNWVNRGTAWRFCWPLDREIPSLVDLLRVGRKSASEAANFFWRSRLDLLTRSRLHELFEPIPMSVASRTFAIEVVLINAERIRDDYDNACS